MAPHRRPRPAGPPCRVLGECAQGDGSAVAGPSQVPKTRTTKAGSQAGGAGSAGGTALAHRSARRPHLATELAGRDGSRPVEMVLSACRARQPAPQALRRRRRALARVPQARAPLVLRRRAPPVRLPRLPVWRGARSARLAPGSPPGPGWRGRPGRGVGIRALQRAGTRPTAAGPGLAGQPGPLASLRAGSWVVRRSRGRPARSRVTVGGHGQGAVVRRPTPTITTRGGQLRGPGCHRPGPVWTGR